MATYAIGDIQGCYQSFRKLLKKIQFDPQKDQLWLAGDMINRGPNSLATMEYLLEHQNSVRCVLGNHDLHFLAVANHCQKIGDKDTFGDILNSKLRDEIVYWLTKQPLVIYDKKLDTLMVHAGLPFYWSQRRALKFSKEVSQVLQSHAAYQFYVSMYGNTPDSWSKSHRGVDRLRFITNAFTRMRYCYLDGRLELKVKSALDKQPEHLIPWFGLENTRYQGNIVFGHWASLQGYSPYPNIHALDTGCVWGGRLTAMRLEDNKRFWVKGVG